MPRTTTSAVGPQIAGRAIRQARAAQRLTQEQLAQRISASGPYIANLEAGRENLTVGQLTALAEALGCALKVSLEPVDAVEVVLPDAAAR